MSSAFNPVCLFGEISRTSFQNKVKFMSLYKCKIQPRSSLSFHPLLLYSEIGQTCLRKKKYMKEERKLKKKEQEEGKKEK